jgi:hypothetical protein
MVLTNFTGLGGLRTGLGTAEELMSACPSAVSLSIVVTCSSPIGGSLPRLEVEISENLPEE